MKALINALASAGGMLKLLKVMKTLVIITTGIFVLSQTVGIIKAIKD